MPRTARIAAGVLGSALVLTACTTPDRPPGDGSWSDEPTDAQLAALAQAGFDDAAEHAEQFYFVMTDRFADGDPSNNTGGLEGDAPAHGYDPTKRMFYQGGDLAGVEQRLDYIEGLGTTAIWLTPVVVNQPVQVTDNWTGAGYHGYWGTDFTAVDPHLGDDAELQSLIGAAHDRGIEVYLDIVVNHTADAVEYAEGSNAYVEKADSPYADADGRPFEDADYAESDEFPAVTADSSAYTPVLEDDEAELKSPAWLNDPTMYHNRGDSTYTGESSTYGDFSGLDDLWTERPEVVDGWIDVYSDWIAESGVDGFRLDTVKHVNLEFWPQFLTGIREAADAKGIDFFAFGEVYSGDPNLASSYVRQGGLDAVLDFGFHGAAGGFATGAAGAEGLSQLYASDALFTSDGTDALAMPTFVSNHDIGRVGRTIVESTDEATWTDRAILAQQLMFLTRGQPVVYYGDEQGFTGSGGDDYSRQTMFASQVEEYLDDELIGTDATHAVDNFDTGHPIYQAIAELSQLREAHPALASGVQVTRAAENGVFAFSRIASGAGTEYLVAVSNSTEAQTVALETYSDTFTPVYGDGSIEAADGAAQITVPPLSAVVFKADSTIDTGDAPSVSLTVEAESATTAYVSAGVSGDPLARVAFAASVDGGDWVYAGTSPGPDHRIAYDLAGLAGGASVEFKAVILDREGRTASAEAATTVATPEQAGGSLSWANVHYDGDPAQWGLYAWGDIAEESQTTWPESNAFAGEDSYGSFAPLKLAEDAGSVGYLVIDGAGNKDYASDRTFDPSATPEIWLSAGSGDVAHSLAEANGYVTVHAPEDGTDWGLHLWGDALADGVATEWDAPRPPDGTDDWGRYWHVPVDDVGADLGMIVHSGDTKLYGSDIVLRPSALGETWVTAAGAHASQAAADGKAVIHYQRPDGDLDGWTLHTWEGAADPTDWNAGIEPARIDSFGAVYEVDLAEGAEALSYILHRGDEKDLPADQRLDFAEYGQEVWVTAATDGYVRPAGASTGRSQDLDLAAEQAIWLDADTVAMNVEATDGRIFELLSSADGSIAAADGALTGNFDTLPLTAAGGLTEAQRRAWPQYWDYRAFKVDADGDAIREALRGQLVAVERDHTGTPWYATAVQTAGAIDAVYDDALNADLGVNWKGKKPTLSLWAPSAQSVSLELFDSPEDTEPSVHEMDFSERTGVWSVKGAKGWDRKYYRFAVEVWHPASQAVESYSVTDPYSLSLAADSTHSQIVDLDAADLRPDGWKQEEAPAEVDPTAAQVWELHVRDFSIADESMDEEVRGTYAAFTQEDSTSVRHLAELAEAGLTHVHLLPTFDIASIPETNQATADCDLDLMAANSTEQQACIGAVRSEDAFNWGYDPLHFNTPEGSYATEADGAQRILEYREMVQAMHELGLRVVNDVVYNHTAASGTADKSVLDRIVPGYYHRLDANGDVQTSTCCANTATERPMFDKFIVESTELWQDAYHVDGFRFDLMGHHPKSNLLAVQAALDDDLLLYGEGWNFGEVANDALFEQATQVNMAGTGIGTFNDRMRDAVRGGGPFDEDPTTQGFGSGAWTDDNDGQATDEELAALMHAQDLTKLGLVGNLADYAFTASDGTATTGAELDYNGTGAGYTAQPGEAVNYVDAHDNEILFDALAYKLDEVTGTERAQMQVLSMAAAVLSQGTGFSTAGSELLRSKSLDRDSYDSGDWFNVIRWNCEGTAGFGPTSNGFGAGLPPQWTSEAKWPYAEDAIASVPQPTCADIELANQRYLELLQISASTSAFNLGDAATVGERVSFPLSGTEAEAPGVITMRIDLDGLDDAFDAVTVVFNAGPEAVTQTVADAAGSGSALHPVLQDSADPAMAEAGFDDTTGTFTVPGRTVAVFTS
ncbi:pullulanase-type alpha-1,6-glucosidase [Glycomyces algeriensis]|uniref:1,4-alpha-D-glucan glucanohydrolase n=1 Tax=Glycomyces algeriensis TaxID=256037 RepID=A0A9W6LIU2_9ACTN|nr:pullulanase-type alpha-1,6-glucosidase [Glycomyces algeriensis]MDA1365608.1 pullulanase-type alpha-1,6-glucosidase [Glycomyces algeriensis]MDR7351296.1 pullulanase-type alpha-1,6-glucosidase [Glycomyces algeriensis]GLI44011.1 1,4-alpha-glucan branching enzyme [Glycomyces algeriensis]